MNGTLIVYPGAHHNFDVVLLTPGVRYGGYWLEYNRPSAKDAEEKTRAFLAAHLAETLPAVLSGAADHNPPPERK